jgi:hypothetical protein
MVPLVHHLQLIFDAGYFVRTEIGAIVEAMAQVVLLLDCRGKDAFTLRVPPDAALLYNYCSEFACSYNCLAKILV